MIKKIIISLILLLTFNSSITSQNYNEAIYVVNHHGKTYSFEYDKCLKFFLDDFFLNPAIKYINLDKLLTFKGIYHTKDIDKIASGAFGVTQSATFTSLSYIMINDKVYHYLPTFLTALVYHEFYHLFTEEGHCYDVVCPYILRDGDYINIERVIKTFDGHEKNEVFRYIQKIQQNN